MKIRKTAFSLLMIALAVTVIVGISGCSTSRNTFPNRAYHNTTCHYNVYWNGQQAMKSAEAEMTKTYKDNYTATLPVYNYPAKSDLGSALPYLDRTIEKCSKAIYKHSMLIKGKEYVKTIDDAYLLMGKSYFYKQDYVQAQRVLNYILHNFANSNSWNEASVLMARTAMRQGYYSTADEQLENLRYLATDNRNRKFNILFNAAKAEYHLTAPDGDKQEAIDFLNAAIEARPKREFKSRMQLIVGELYEQLGQQQEAHQNFMNVIKKSSNYEMVFCAQMHLASNYDGTSSSRNAIMRQFEKMLEEKKNEDFKDQIYYACSEIARIDENDTLRKQYLAKSVSASTTNNYQGTFSSLTLADLYFAENSYRNAQAYYDTAVLKIPKNYPDYDNIIKKANVLKDLVVKLDEIDLQDSLQRIAKMSESERSAWVKKMIADYTEAERRAAAEEAERMLAMQNAASYTNINTTSSNGKWYFYNQSLVTAGQQDFYRRFGNRKLEDNWFVSNKQQISFDDMAVMNDPSLAQDTTEYDENGNPINKRETDPKKEAYYLQDLPMTPGAIDTSNAIIAKDLYEAGFIYQDLLTDYPRACDCFESLLKRFPENEYALPCTYMLYSLHKTLKDNKSDTYKDIILTKYPNTDYAKMILNPNYAQTLAENAKTVEHAYEQIYSDFNQKRWAAVISNADKNIPITTDEELKGKMRYLRAVAAGQVHNEDTLISGLRGVIRDFPNTPIAELAAIYLSTCNPDKVNPPQSQVTENQTSGDKSSVQKPAMSNPFVYKDDEMHYVIMLVRAADLPVQGVKRDLATFNSTYFSLQRFNISSFYINNTHQMVTISKFKDADQAINYYNILSKNDAFSGSIAKGILTVYAMSATNYTTYYNNQESRELYDNFFKEKYLKQATDK